MSGEPKEKLPPGWAWATIENLFWPMEDGRLLHQGWSPQCEKIPAPTDEDWGVLKTTAIQAGAFLYQHNKKLPARLTPRPKNEVKPGDLLLTCAGPRSRCGVACLVRGTRPRLMISGKMYRFRVSPDDFDSRYLEAYLLTPAAQAAIDKMKTGGNDSGLNLTHSRFRPLSVPVAPLNEQRRIMDAAEELLSDLDAGMAAFERVQAKLKQYRTAVLKAAAEGTLTAEWRKEHPATESAEDFLSRILAERRRRWEEIQLQKFKDAGKEPPKNWKAKYKEPSKPTSDDLSPVPNSWCRATLDQLIFGTINGFGKRKQMEGVPHIVLRLADIEEGNVTLKQVRRVNCTDAQVERFSLSPNDLIIIRVNGSEDLVGRLILIGVLPEKVLFCDHFMRATIAMPELATWIRLNGDTQHFRHYVDRHKVSSAGQNTVNQGLLSLSIPLPPAEEQIAIVEAIEEQFSVIDHLETELAKKLSSALALRQSILRHAFTGQLVPQDPGDEPADELLKRIASERAKCLELIRATKQAPAKGRRKRTATKKS